MLILKLMKKNNLCFAASQIYIPFLVECTSLKESASFIQQFFYCMSTKLFRTSNFYKIITGVHKSCSEFSLGDSMVFYYQDNSKRPKIILKIGQMTLIHVASVFYDGCKYNCYRQMICVRQSKITR